MQRQERGTSTRPRQHIVRRQRVEKKYEERMVDERRGRRRAGNDSRAGRLHLSWAVFITSPLDLGQPYRLPTATFQTIVRNFERPTNEFPRATLRFPGIKKMFPLFYFLVSEITPSSEDRIKSIVKRSIFGDYYIMSWIARGSWKRMRPFPLTPGRNFQKIEKFLWS